MARGDFRPISDIRRVHMRCTETILAGEAVVLGTNGVDLAAQGEKVYGFAMGDGVAGDIIAIGKGGTWAGTADATDLAFASHVYFETGGVLGDGASGDFSMGTVVDKDPAASGEVIFEHNEFVHQHSLFVQP